MATLPAGEPLKEVDLAPKRHTASSHTHTGRVTSAEGKPRSTLAREGVVLFRVNLGAKDKAEPGWLLPLVCRRGAVTRKEVGAIRVERDHTLIEIVASAAAEFAANAGEKDPRAPHVRIERAEATAKLAAAPSYDRGAAKKSVHPMRKGKTTYKK
jgi:ATP-dependent RNA helicase DeaD